MKTRILTAVIGLALLVGVLLLPPIALYCAFSLICALAVYETFSVTGLKKHRCMFVFSLLFAVAAPFFGVADSRLLFSAALTIFVLALVLGQLRHHADIPLSETGLAFFCTLILSVGISCTAYCRALNENGLFYFILALIIAWGNDTGAYFAGTFFGKHKLCPEISPKKTVEGLVGGWVFSVAAALLLSYIWQRTAGVAPLYWQVTLTAFLLSPLSVVGDLFASTIKRQSGTKDFGNIMPGHGGIMDRFDSLVFVAPLLFALLHIFTLFG